MKKRFGDITSVVSSCEAFDFKMIGVEKYPARIQYCTTYECSKLGTYYLVEESEYHNTNNNPMKTTTLRK